MQLIVTQLVKELPCFGGRFPGLLARLFRLKCTWIFLQSFLDRLQAFRAKTAIMVLYGFSSCISARIAAENVHKPSTRNYLESTKEQK
jgi:hypothetical protein